MSSTKKAASFTIRIDLLKWLQERAKKERQSKSQVMEIALEKLKEAQRDQKLQETCKKIQADAEMHELAEMGFEDTLAMIDRHEKGR